MSINTEKLRKILIEDYKYEETQVDDFVKKVLSMDPSILKSFEEYLESQEMPEYPVYSGSSPAILAATYPQKPPAIFLLLEWIRDDHVAAYTALQREYNRLPEPKTLN